MTEPRERNEDAEEITDSMREREDQMSFRAWLWYEHNKVRPKSKYLPLTRLILGGGPDGMWTNVHKPLYAAKVRKDLAEMFATGRAGITAVHMGLMNEAYAEYREQTKSVHTLMNDRLRHETDARLAIGEEITDAVAPHLEGTSISLTSKETRFAEPLARTVCTYVSTNGRGCSRMAWYGTVVCDIHGGQYLSEDDAKDIIKHAQSKILEVSVEAIDTIVDVMQNSVNDAFRLKAAEMILDRSGLKATGDPYRGLEPDKGDSPESIKAADIIRERLERLGSHGNGDIIEGSVVSPEDDQ